MPGYKERRKVLIDRLGGSCVDCGAKRNLVFDHIDPRKWTPNKLSKLQRLRHYERATKEGKIQLLCENCHNGKTAAEGHGWLPGWLKGLVKDLNPF